MKVYALVGKSGTGKSYQAMNISREMDISAIIDDGLFIVGNGILAGVSAKRQGTKIGAIKTALFTNEEHKEAVTDKIREVAPDSILVIGTSDVMVKKIAERLELPEISHTIYIESITTEKEREVAHKQRNDLGKHVIPVPTFQIKREFSGYFVDPLRIFRGLGLGKGGFAEKSVVRPTYSYRGDYVISDKVIGDIINYIGDHIHGVGSIIRISTEKTKMGIRITILVIMKYGCHIMDVAKEFQERVAMQVENMTAFHIEAVNIEVRDLK